MGEERGVMTPTKLVLFIAMLLIFYQAIIYFYGAILFPILILYGIILLVFVALIFISLDLIGLGPIKLPYFWWLMLIIGVLLIVFDFLAGVVAVIPLYFTGTLVILAVLMELVGEKMKLAGCKFMVFFGVLFGIWDCVTIFIGTASALAIVNAVFGLILMVILLILVFDFVDIKIPYKWWVLLIIAFVMYMFVQGSAGGYPVTGFSGWILMIAFVCHVYFKEG
jgi:hypothetical protein